MQLKKTFEIAFAPDAVWRGLSDVRLVAGCLPGASIVEEVNPDEYKGKLAIKVGPLAASFDGLISLERRPAERTAIVTGKGADAKSSSRVTATMTYRVQPSASNAQGSQVDIESDINLAGALAQFGKAAVMQEVANRMTNEFVKRFEAQMAHADATGRAAEPAPAAATPPTAPSPPTDAAPSTAEVGGNTSVASATASAVNPAGRSAEVPRPAPAARPGLQPAPAHLDAGNLFWSIFKDRISGFFRKLFK